MGSFSPIGPGKAAAGLQGMSPGDDRQAWTVSRAGDRQDGIRRHGP
jgi:hypothetical protein